MLIASTVKSYANRWCYREPKSGKLRTFSFLALIHPATGQVTAPLLYITGQYQGAKMLLEGAYGDSYGLGFEFSPKEFVYKNNNLSCYVQHPNHSIIPGDYSDDTQMSLAIAEFICDEEEWTPENIAQKFVEVYKRDPIDGYASGFKGLLEEVESGQDLLNKIVPDSDKSGAAMRATPIGIYKDIPEILYKTGMQARITHNTVNGVRAALVAALAAHYFIYNIGPKAELMRWLQKYIKADWIKPYNRNVGSKGWMSVAAALTAISQSENMSQLLQMCIAFTGDVDTVATIAMSAACWSPEITKNLPKFLREDLQNGPYGRDYIIRLDKRLIALRS